MHLSIPSRPLATAAICGALTFALPGCRPAPEIPRTPETIEELAQALGPNYRPLQARLTGGFGYAPCKQLEHSEAASAKAASTSSSMGHSWQDPDEDLVPSVRCSTRDSLSLAQRDRLRLARSRHLPKPDEDPTIIYRGPGDPPAPEPENLHLAAITELAHGENADLDLVVELLEAASGQNPENPKLLSDLSGAYLLRGQEHDRPRDLARALAAADQALELGPDLPEAVFNRAFALDSWFLTDLAKDAWKRYLELDGESEWADEARQRLGLLRQPTAEDHWQRIQAKLSQAKHLPSKSTLLEAVRFFPREAWVSVAQQQLLLWSEATSRGESEDARNIATSLSLITSRLSERLQDGSLDDISRLVQGDDAHQQRDFATSYLRLVQAAKSSNPEELRSLASATGESQCLIWTRAVEALALNHYRKEDFQASLQSLSALLSPRTETCSLLAEARAHWLSGLNLLVLGRHTDALEDYSIALKSYESIHDTPGSVSIHRLLVELFFQLGESQSAWHHLYRAMEQFQSLTAGSQRVALLAVVARSVSSQAPAMAFYLHSLMLSESSRLGVAHGIVDALTYRAADLARLNRHNKARGDIEAARQRLRDVHPVQRQNRQRADLHFVEAAFVQSDPAQALVAATKALEHYTETSHSFYILPALLAKAQALLQLGEVALAERTISEATSEARRQTASLTDDWLRSTYQQELKALTYERLRVLRRLGAPPHVTLSAVEEMRAGSLEARLRAAKSTKGQPEFPGAGKNEVESAVSLVPPGTILLSYHFTEREATLWVATAASVQEHRLPVPVSEIEDKVERFLQLLATHRHRASIRNLGTELFLTLLKPLDSALAVDTRLIIVPSGPLYQLPFAALFRPGSSEPLVSEVSISYIPSLGTLAASLGSIKSKKPASQSAQLVIVGNSQSVRFGTTTLPGLKHAQAEAARIASLYPAGAVDSSRATSAAPGDFLKALGQARVVHFIGHSLPLSSSNLGSVLFFGSSPESGYARLLSARDLWGRDSSGTELVLLSSCSSAAGTRLETEGPLGAARSLLGGGVSSVIATLWDVEDQASSALFESIHSGLLRGLEPSIALQQAQRLASVREPHSFDWAATVTIGSH